MTISAKALIEAKYAAASATTEYTTAANTKTIIDKFTATNTDGSTRTITVHIVPSGGTAGGSNIITSALSMTTGLSVDLPEMKNQILNAGDFIAVLASVASKVVIRASGREIT